MRIATTRTEKDRNLFDTEVKERTRLNNYLGKLQAFMKVKVKSRHKHSAMPKSGNYLTLI